MSHLLFSCFPLPGVLAAVRHTGVIAHTHKLTLTLALDAQTVACLAKARVLPSHYSPHQTRSAPEPSAVYSAIADRVCVWSLPLSILRTLFLVTDAAAQSATIRNVCVVLRVNIWPRSFSCQEHCRLCIIPIHITLKTTVLLGLSDGAVRQTRLGSSADTPELIHLAAVMGRT